MSDLASITPIILSAFFLWLVGLTVVFYRLLSHYKRIGSRTKSQDLIKLLESVLNKEDKVLSDIASVRKEIHRIDTHMIMPFQKMGLVKFNPFNEIGGDHSFSLTLLNNNDDGVVLTGLHTRERTRVYLKQISSGVSKVELSKEEEKSVQQAIKQR